MMNKSARSLGQIVREDRLTEHSRDRLNEMVVRISASRNPREIESILRCEVLNIVHDYNLAPDAPRSSSREETS